MKINFDCWKVKVKHYNRGRMKIIVDLNKEESESFVQFKSFFLAADDTPETNEKFVKMLFMMGAEQYQLNFQKHFEKQLRDPEVQKTLREQGIDPSQFAIEAESEDQNLVNQTQIVEDTNES